MKLASACTGDKNKNDVATFCATLALDHCNSKEAEQVALVVVVVADVDHWTHGPIGQALDDSDVPTRFAIYSRQIESLPRTPPPPRGACNALDAKLSKANL